MEKVYKKSRDKWRKIASERAVMIMTKEELIRRLEEALRFYANINNYEKGRAPGKAYLFESVVEMDKGKTAKGALNEEA